MCLKSIYECKSSLSHGASVKAISPCWKIDKNSPRGAIFLLEWTDMHLFFLKRSEIGDKKREESGKEEVENKRK